MVGSSLDARILIRGCRTLRTPRLSRASLGEKTSVSAARILREAIIAGELLPGQTLGEESLGKQLGISRTPVREALVLLRSEGLVDTPPNRPAIVRDFLHEDLHEIYSLRAVLEGYGARLAATQLEERQLEELQRSCDRYLELGRRDDRLRELTDENFTFHTTILGAARSERLQLMIRQVTTVPLIYRSYLTYSPENRQSAWQDHVRILGALTARDPERAESLMKAHVLWARDVALDHLPLVHRDRDRAAAS
jgi:DNA-binding GntR family transcriptional regulator